MLVSTLGADLDGHAIAVVDLIGAITLAFYAHTLIVPNWGISPKILKLSETADENAQ